MMKEVFFQVGVLDVSIRHNISTGVNVLIIRVGARLYIYESTGIMASDDQLGGCIIKDATFDRGFEPSGLNRFGHVDIYSAKGEDETQLIVGNQFYQFKVMGIE